MNGEFPISVLIFCVSCRDFGSSEGGQVRAPEGGGVYDS